MFKPLALTLALFPALALAQTAPTRPTGDNSNSIATTAFVQNTVPANLAQMPANTVVCNPTSSTAPAQDCTTLPLVTAQVPITADGFVSSFQMGPNSATSIYQQNFGSFTYDGVRSALTVPATTTAQNVNGFAYYVRNQVPISGGAHGAVGLFGTVTCEVDNCSSWGLNPTVGDSATQVIGSGVGRKIIGAEIDYGIVNPGTTVTGISLLGSALVQPSFAGGFNCGSLSVQANGLARWTNCFIVGDNAASQYGTVGLPFAPSATVTISIASPGVITDANHNFTVGQQVVFSTTGALPTGITAGTTYCVIAAGLATSAFEISTSCGGAAVNTSGTQSGVQTVKPVSGASIALVFNNTDLTGVEHGLNLLAQNNALIIQTAGFANSIALKSASTGNPVSITSSGTDANVPLNLLAQGTANVLSLSPFQIQTNGGQLILNTLATSQQAITTFQSAGTTKWQLGKQTDDTFLGFDTPNNKAWLTISTGGSVTLGETASTVILNGTPQTPGVATGTPVASLCLDASNNVIKKTTTGSCI